MKKCIFIIIGLFLVLAEMGCNTKSSLGTKVKEPFTGNKYESNDRYFRGVGKGESKDQNISESKADLQAKKELAQQISTTIKSVTDQYYDETEVNKASELNEKFQTLVREVTNTSLVDLRKIDQQQFTQSDGDYLTYVAYEINKRDMFRFLKKQAKSTKYLNQIEQEKFDLMLDHEIERMDKLEKIDQK
jgi:hypothetical protein